MIQLVTIILLGLLASNVQGMKVIHDTGKTLPLSDYAQTKDAPELNKKKEEKTPAMTILPIRTAGMSPGKVDARRHRIPHFQVPLFILGSDPMSRAWIMNRREQLVELNAVGMLVQAETEQDLRDMKALTEGLWVFPASGDDVGKELNLTHYPALISKIGIEQ